MKKRKKKANKLPQTPTDAQKYEQKQLPFNKLI